MIAASGYEREALGTARNPRKFVRRDKSELMIALSRGAEAAAIYRITAEVAYNRKSFDGG